MPNTPEAPEPPDNPDVPRTPGSPTPLPSCTLHAGEAAPLERAAELLFATAESVLRERNQLAFAIPGGSAMGAALLLKAALGIRWSRVALTWVDERCVATGDPDSNFGTALRAGIERDAAPLKTLPLFRTHETPIEALGRVSEGLKGAFEGGLDLALLGMGEDGHIASIFPESGFQESRKRPSFPNVEHIQNSPKPPPNRITLTRRYLATAECAVLVAAGEKKRTAIEGVMNGDMTLPAVGLPNLHIVTDLEIPSPPLQRSAE